MDIDSLALNFRNVLLKTQYMPADDLRAYQGQLVEKLVAHARAHTDWYAGLASDAVGENWSGVPLVTRPQVHKNIKAIQARALPPFCGAPEESQTSGSSGNPLRFLKDSLFDVASASQTDRLFAWWSVNGNKQLCSFMSTYTLAEHSGVSRRGQWRLGCPDGERRIMELMIDIDRQIDWLADVQPDYLFVRGGEHLRALASRALARNVRIRPHRIFSSGSPMPPIARQQARRAFKATVVDTYGATETGMIACECPDCGFYHCCDETVQVEILRSDGSPCLEGETGRVALTVLYGYATPLIRYEIGDYAMRGPDKARCGRGLTSITRITGRYRNTFRLADGRLIHPYVNASGLSQHLAYLQAQIVQIDVNTLEIRYVPDPASDREPDEAIISKFIKSAFDPSLDVRLKPCAQIASGPDGKYEETLSLVSDSADADLKAVG